MASLRSTFINSTVLLLLAFKNALALDEPIEQQQQQPQNKTLLSPFDKVIPVGRYNNARASDQPTEQPPLTGTLLSPFGYVIPVGHYNVEPYFSANTRYGAYDHHWKERSVPKEYTLNVQPFTWFGLSERWDIQIGPQFSWNHVSGASHWVLNDVPIELEYQILSEKPNNWRPAIKFAFLLTLPLGRYQKLNPHKRGTDLGGEGNWQPGAELTFQKLFTLSNGHYLCGHYTLNYTIPTPVHVKGLNAYGGGHHTRGKVYPGQIFQTILGLEYTLTSFWALALDIQYDHINRTRFKGHKGETDGEENVIGPPSSEQLSLAPAIECNWSQNFGIVGGVWFSIAGRNTEAFANVILAINFYI